MMANESTAKHRSLRPQLGQFGLVSVLIGAFLVSFVAPSSPASLASSASFQTPPQLVMEEFASGFESPVKITHAGDDRLFVVEQGGTIRIVTSDGTQLTTPFLNITGRVLSGGERGLLGLVFAPDDPTTFYVNYTRRGQNDDERGDTVIARFRVSATDANQADPDSEEIILVVDQPFANHNAGDLAFGPDGYLYVPLGDGGSGGDPNNNAQRLSQLLGKILRIDVSGQTTYAVPPDNPFANDGDDTTLAEIWSYGWRNPWRFSFDRATGEMYVGDVGQVDWEEIDVELANTPGRNYGWNRCEGSYVYPGQDPPVKCSTTDTLVEPVFDYPRDDGNAVTGGYVYRGTRYPNLVGHYIFADYGRGNFWSMIRDANGDWQVTKQGQLGVSNPSSFGENSAGELFVASLNGRIYHVTDSSVVAETATPTITPTLSPTHTLVPITPESMTPQSYLPLVNNSD